MSYGNDQYGQSANYGGGNDPYGQGGNDPYGQNQGGSYDPNQGGGYPEPAGVAGAGYGAGAGAYGAPARPSIKFPQALPLAFKNFATFSGRASRSEYWFFLLALVVISVILSTLASLLGGGVNPETMQYNNGLGTAIQSLSGLVGLAVLVPHLAVAARRLHDTNRSALWLLLLLGSILVIPVIVLLVFLAGESKPEGARFDNPDGSQPKLP